MSHEQGGNSTIEQYPSGEEQLWLAQWAAFARFAEALARQAEVPNTELYLVSGQDFATKEDLAWMQLTENYEQLMTGKGGVEVLRVGLPVQKLEGWEERPEKVALAEDAYLLLRTNYDGFETLERITALSDWRGVHRDLGLKIRTYELMPGRFVNFDDGRQDPHQQ